MSESGDAIGENPEQLRSTWQQSLVALPVATFNAGETVVT